MTHEKGPARPSEANPEEPSTVSGFNSIPEALETAIANNWKILPLHSIKNGKCDCREGAGCGAPGKHPRLRNGVHAASDDSVTITAWYKQWPDSNWGLATGSASGLFVIDVDAKHGGYDSIEGLDLPPTIRVLTGGGGRHYYYEMPSDGERISNRVNWLSGVDVRGDDGYVVMPGSVHIAGARYSWEVPNAEMVEAPESIVESIRTRSTSGAATDVLSDTATILEGIPEGQRDHTLFKWACRLRRQHESDDDGGRAAVTVLVLHAAAASGFPRDQALAKVAQAFKQDRGELDNILWDGRGETNSWEPIDLTDILAGNYEPLLPTVMRRTDGVLMLYPGKIHSFHGEPESGKSFAAQGVAAQVLTDGGRVLYLDYESDAVTVVDRLLRMGTAINDIQDGFVYVTPDSRPEKGMDALLDEPYALAVVDGVTEALVISGAGSNDNDEVTAWNRKVGRKIVEKTDAAVVMVDHVTKSKDSRGRNAIGAQAKLSMLTGPAYIFSVMQPLGIGLRGEISVRIGKDRPGRVRPHGINWRASDSTQEIASVVVDSTGPGTVFTIEPPDGATAKKVAVEAADKNAAAARAIVSENPGLNTGKLKEKISEATGVHNAQDVVRIVTDAENRGYIRAEKGPRNSRLFYPGDGIDATAWADAQQV